MRRLAFLLLFALVPTLGQAQPVRPYPSWLRYYLPIRPQVFPGSPFGGGGGGGGGTTLPVVDTTTIVKGSGDPTKLLRFEVDGVTAGNTIVPFTFSGTTAAPVTSFALGGATAPSISFTAGDGFYSRAGTAVDVASNGTAKLEISSPEVALASGLRFGFAPGAIGAGNTDAFFMRDAAAVMQLGEDVNGAAVNQTLKAHDGITGSNVIGANLTFSSGVGTGLGAGAQTSMGRALMTTTGTTQQTRVEALTACESKTLSNTSATAQTVVNIASASNSGGCAEWTSSVVATDGTNFDAESQTCDVCWVNKAGTFTITAAPVCTATVAASNSGSTTVGSTVTGAASVISIKVTPVFTTIVPTTVTGYTTVRNNSPGAVTCQ